MKTLNAQVQALGGATLNPTAPDFVDMLLAEIERLSVLYGSRGGPSAHKVDCAG